jgi:hypothetical protein
MSLTAPDLTKQAPRSPRVRLGGYACLPRCLDKGRATLTGKNGEYHYNCPLDQRLLEFIGIDADALSAQLAAGKGDGDILAWINTSAKNRHTPAEIAVWSAEQTERKPDNPESLGYFNDIKSKCAPHRTDIANWFDLLDVDDYVSFGGLA